MSVENKICVEDNIGLVHLCAKRFNGRGVEYEDLFQIGCLGLVKAAKKFDSDRGLKFSTYAVPVILGEIKGFFRADGIIKVSRGIKELARKIQQETEKFMVEHKTSPTVSYLASTLNESEEKISQAMNSLAITLSLTQSDDETNAAIDVKVDSEEESLTDKLSLIQTIEKLSDYDRELIRLRYFKNKTQKETAEVLGCSQVQISRREKKVLFYMRSYLCD